MRKCYVCKEEKDFSNFYGKETMCKPCRKIHDAGRRRDGTKAARDAYRLSEKGKARDRRYRASHADPVKDAARAAVHHAIEAGKLSPPNECQTCGGESKRRDGARGIQAHHHNGYDNPLDVVWLCQPCHVKEHKSAAITGSER